VPDQLVVLHQALELLIRHKRYLVGIKAPEGLFKSRPACIHQRMPEPGTKHPPTQVRQQAIITDCRQLRRIKRLRQQRLDIFTCAMFDHMLVQPLK
jgi:hypothetical protein